jgi:TolA-binding protein
MRTSRRLAPVPVALLLALLAACASRGPADTTPTLKSLATRAVELPKDTPVEANDDATIAAYRDYLKKAPADPQRPEAIRRLGDLEMDNADAPTAQAAGKAAAGAVPAAAPLAAQRNSAVAPDSAAATAPAQPGSALPAVGARAAPDDAQSYKRAVVLYEELLKNFPHAPDTDRVLYQLAHAYESGGDLDAALRVLDRLVRDHPGTPYLDEAQFRRGELQFSMRNYADAETAYATILAHPAHTPYFDRALYMRGWAQYKQGKLEDALHSFFGVLDLKLIARDTDTTLEAIPGLSRADRELVEDTLRVTSLCLANLDGAASIPTYMNSPLRRDYEYRIYEQLGALYLKQERAVDAANTYNAFARRNPAHAQAPQLQARVIEIYQQGGFDTLVLEGKKEYVERYGLHGQFRRVNTTGWARAQPLVKANLLDLTRHFHAAAQKSKKHADYEIAVRWYREFLESFPGDPQAAQENFLLAEILFEDAHFAEAALEYEKAAYHYLPHARSADAGYAALLSYAEQEKRTDAGQRGIVQLAAIESALRFGYAFAADPRAGPVLSNAAEKLYGLHELERASAVAQMVLKLDPPAAPAQQRVAWTVLALAAFDGGAYDRAESAYGELLARTPDADPERHALGERLAASVYKQGEVARNEGRVRDAVGHFMRVGTVAPDSPVRATAQFDAAAVLIGLKDWSAAAQALEDFRQRYPKHALQDDVGNKLAAVYTESSQWQKAAAEFERIAARNGDPQLARAALWQAAELYEKAAMRPAAAKVYVRYLTQYPQPLEPALEARVRLSGFARDEGDPANALAWQKDLLQAEQAGGAGRTDRTRYLGATAALVLAGPVYEDYRKVALVEPLKKQLKLKKAKLEDVLKAYAVAASYGVADVATDAAFHTAELYREFGQALMSSERPKGLSKDEVEQYDVMLEEQAFPFEEKAVALHEANAHHSAEGIYDQWVKRSFEALAALRPLRYGKIERSEDTIDAIR